MFICGVETLIAKWYSSLVVYFTLKGCKLMEETNMLFARNLQYWLLVRDMQQKELADRLGVSKSAVCLWCSGDNMPRMKKITAMAEIFGCTRADLIENDLTKKESFSIPNNISEAKKEFIRQILDMPDEKIKVLSELLKTFKETR